MENTYTITEAEYVKANKLFTKASPKLIVAYVMASLALVIFAVYTDSTILRIGALGAIIGGAIGHFFVTLVYAPWRTRRQYRSYKAAQEPIIISNSGDGISFSSAIGDAKIDWDRIFRWRENTELILIYQAPEVYHIIPKRIGDLSEEISRALMEKVGNAS